MTLPMTSSYAASLIRRTGDNPATVEMLLQQLEMSEVDVDGRLLLERKLNAALVMVENYTGLSLTECERTAYWESMAGVVRLPFGPVRIDPEVVVTNTGGTVSLSGTYAVSGGTFPMLTGSYPTGVSVAYTAGFTPQADAERPELDAYVLPDVLLDAILICAAELYCQTTGFQAPKKLMNNWRSLAAPFRRF